MNTDDFESWYTSADEDMPIPELEDSKQYRRLRKRQWNRLRHAVAIQRNGYLWRSIAASILFLGLASAVVYHRLQQRTAIQASTTIFQTLAGETKQVELPDKSMLYLYEETTVEMPNWGDQRTVQLVKGHVFVDVQPDSLRPFLIDTDLHQIKVLGTSFWVRGYVEESSREVTVQSGKVEVTDRSPSGQRNILAAGNRLVYSIATGQTTIQQNLLEAGDDSDHFSLHYHDATLRDILADLKRRYGTEIQPIRQDLLEDRYTISFATDLSLEECVQKLRIIGGSDLKFEPNGKQ